MQKDQDLFSACMHRSECRTVAVSYCRSTSLRSDPTIPGPHGDMHARSTVVSTTPNVSCLYPVSGARCILLVRPAGLITFRSSRRTAEVVCSSRSPRSSASDGIEEKNRNFKRQRRFGLTDSSNKAQHAGAGRLNPSNSSSTSPSNDRPVARRQNGDTADDTGAGGFHDNKSDQHSSADHGPAHEKHSRRGQHQQQAGRGGGSDRSGSGGSGGRGSGNSRGGRGRNSGEGAVPPQVLTSLLKIAQSPEQLLQLLQQHTGNLNHIHLGAAFTHAVTVCHNSVPQQQQPAAAQQLLAELHQDAEQLQQQCGARQLANIIWSCGRLSTVDTAAMLLPVFLQDSNLQQAEPQHVANVVWAAATLQLQLTTDQWQQLLMRRFDAVLADAKAQEVSNTLWAAAIMGRTVTDSQLQRWLQHFQRVLPQATPQAISNTLWAVATMQQQMQPAQLQQLLQRFVYILPQATPQAVSNVLWAVATMQPQPPVHTGLLQRLLQHPRTILLQAKPQDVSNNLWACGKLQYAPLQLLSALERHPQHLQALLAAATPQHLSNMAWACSQLGYRGKLLPGALLRQALKLLQDEGDSKLMGQNLCNLCWSAAVLDVQQHLPSLLQLAAATQQVQHIPAREELQQLYQVHLWLLDSQLPAPGQGLSGVLSQQQLEQCRASWEQQLQERRREQSSDLERSVFAAVQQLPEDLWQQQPASQQVTADGLFSIDIAATTASGVKVAIEVDGPSHFIQPGNVLEGSTMFRNRALAARGYVVVSIPFRDWNALKAAEQKQQYLLTKLAKL